MTKKILTKIKLNIKNLGCQTKKFRGKPHFFYKTQKKDSYVLKTR